MIEKIEEISKREKTVIIEGGAGFYLKMLLTHNGSSDDIDEQLAKHSEYVESLTGSIQSLE
jgi:tRNA A37 N6-isopentenylltransferase MiaA